MGVSIAILLLSMLYPLSTPAIAQTSNDPSDSPCTGDPTADYNSQCGPSVAIPGWSDGGGWNNDLQAGTIELVDLNGDGTDELVGLGPHGVQVHSFSTDPGQWVQAYDDTQPLPFANNAVLGGLDTVRFGQLAEGKWGVIGIVFDPSNNNALVGLETWSWNPGNGTLGSGSWTLEQVNGPFGPGSTPNWTSNPGYWSTIQFVAEPLEGVGYSIIARGNTGMVRCSWDDSGPRWWCGLAGDAFNDSVMSDSNGNPADYLYDTVQTADIYQETAGPELFGLQNSSDPNQRNLKVYSWDSSSQQFIPLQTSGSAPFWSPQSQWYDVKYSSTIQAVQLLGNDQPLQVIGRSQQGLEYHSLNADGCGGLTPPCWKDITVYAGSRPLSDYDGYGDPQYYATMRFADIDGDGIDELVVRDPLNTAAGPGQIAVYQLHPTYGWYPQQGIATPVLTTGPSDDPLWGAPGYYETIRIGDITGAGFLSMIARGKYGVRTWTIQNGFARPQAYGFDPFTTAEQNAYALAGAFVGLDPNSGTTIRDQYSANAATTLDNYQTCLQDSLNQPMPPAQTCDAFPPQTALPNLNGVTAEQWQSMANLLLDELSAAIVLTEYISDVSGLITQLYFADESSFNNTVYELFPAPPSPSSNLFATLFPLFVGLARSAAIVAGIGIISGTLLAFQTIFNALDSMQTPVNNANTKPVKLEEVQSFLSTTTAEALSRQQDIYQSIAADRGLLMLYGDMLNQGFWNMTDDRRNATTSLIEYHTSIWIYQTLTPLFWKIGVCEVGGGDGGPNQCWDGYSANLGSNAAYVNSGWIAYLTHLDNFEGITPSSSSGALFQRVFDANADGTCIIGGTDPDTNWTNDSSACNGTVDINDVLFFKNGWVTFSCTVYQGLGVFQDKCGTVQPYGYAPPGN